VQTTSKQSADVVTAAHPSNGPPAGMRGAVEYRSGTLHRYYDLLAESVSFPSHRAIFVCGNIRESGSAHHFLGVSHKSELAQPTRWPSRAARVIATLGVSPTTVEKLAR
jgi:hypothetical protein